MKQMQHYHNKNKREYYIMKYIFPIIILIFCLMPAHLFASQNRSLYIEFSYEEPDIPGVEVSGFRLYKDGVQVCQINSYYSQSFECEFQSGNGKFDFTLAPLFSNNSVGPTSKPYSVTIGNGGGSTIGTVQIQGVMANITKLLLDKG
jgi:hypothetical protein